MWDEYTVDSIWFACCYETVIQNIVVFLKDIGVYDNVCWKACGFEIRYLKLLYSYWTDS